MTKTTKAAVYARVSTADQDTENQLIELRRYIDARGWALTSEYIDHGVSGSRDRRPALDRLTTDAKRRRFDVVVIWSLDRLGRNLKHLITTLDEYQALGVMFISLREGLDWTTPAGRLQAQLLAMISEFEKGRIVERVRAGIARARTGGKRFGRRRKTPAPPEIAGLTVRQAAERWNVSKTTAARWITEGRIPTGQTPANPA